jgi:hypothetical protein
MDNPHLVYVFARVGEGGMTSPVKVGISREANARLATVQTSCPFKIELAYVFELPNRTIALELERAFHVTQKHKCAHGEWFDFEPVEAIYLLCIGLRTLIQRFVTDRSIHEDVLDCAGVLWAEKRFNLAIPGKVMQ